MNKPRLQIKKANIIELSSNALTEKPNKIFKKLIAKTNVKKESSIDLGNSK
jgi:hypothetical protein